MKSSACIDRLRRRVHRHTLAFSSASTAIRSLFVTAQWPFADRRVTTARRALSKYQVSTQKGLGPFCALSKYQVSTQKGLGPFVR
jgi:hypothetical protein